MLNKLQNRVWEQRNRQRTNGEITEAVIKKKQVVFCLFYFFVLFCFLFYSDKWFLDWLHSKKKNKHYSCRNSSVVYFRLSFHALSTSKILTAGDACSAVPSLLCMLMHVLSKITDVIHWNPCRVYKDIVWISFNLFLFLWPTRTIDLPMLYMTKLRHSSCLGWEYAHAFLNKSVKIMGFFWS